MKLLIITQAVDQRDPVLGFFPRWIEEFAKHAEQVVVICLREGTHELPGNVAVHSLGKERGRVSRSRYAYRFLKLAWKLRREYDAVFVHMNPEYLVLAGWLWRARRVPTALWYLHKAVSLRLRSGILFANVVLTASEASMRVRTHKKRVVGHGIDTAFFAPVPAPEGPITCVTVSRIAPVKRIDLLIQAALREGVRLVVAGEASPDDARYLKHVKDIARMGKEGRIAFLGPQDQRGVREAFKKAHLFLHASATGSLDKAPLEALSCGVPVVTMNTELAAMGCPAVTGSGPTLESFGLALHEAITHAPWKDETIRDAAHAFVRERFDLTKLVERVLTRLEVSIPSTSLQDETERETREHFNSVAKESNDGSYEARRWAANPRVVEQRRATAAFIERVVVPYAARSARIMELGPGPGTWTRRLASANTHAQLILLDISSGMLERARAAASEVSSVGIREGEFLSVAVMKGETDLFFSSRALEYVVDKDAAARKIMRILAAGGTGCVITKMPKTFVNRVMRRRTKPLHRHQVRPRDLQARLREAGATQVRLYPVTFAMPFLRSAAADRLARLLLARLPLNPLSAFLAESYAVTFRKP